MPSASDSDRDALLADRRVLVVEDDPTVREVTCEYLREAGFIVDEAADGIAALRRAEATPPDLIVLDRMLPGVSGVEVCRRIRRTSDTPVIMLTALGSVEERIEGLEAGADDYLPKPFEPRELLLRIATILRRVQTTRTEEVIRFGPFTFNRTTAELRRAEEVIHLTTGEISLLQALAAKPGRSVSRAELGDKGVVAGSDRAVDVQMARLRRKIEDDPRQPRYILTMRGSGYVLRLAS